MLKKITHSSANSESLMACTVQLQQYNYKCMACTPVQLQEHDVCNCTIKAQIRLLMTNQI